MTGRKGFTHTSIAAILTVGCDPFIAKSSSWLQDARARQEKERSGGGSIRRENYHLVEREMGASKHVRSQPDPLSCMGCEHERTILTPSRSLSLSLSPSRSLSDSGGVVLVAARCGRDRRKHGQEEEEDDLVATGHVYINWL